MEMKKKRIIRKRKKKRKEKKRKKKRMRRKCQSLTKGTKSPMKNYCCVHYNNKK
jgi:hypothetical protein